MKKPFGFIVSLCLAGAAVNAGSAIAAQGNASPTPAAPAASLTPGTNVHDSAGEVIGKIAQVEGGKVAVAVEDRGVVIPANAFVATPKGPALNVTKAKLLASVKQAAQENDAAVSAALKVGADVRSAGGSAVLGQVKAVAADSALLTTGAGDVTVPRSVLFVSNAGLATTLSAQQFAAAVAQSRAAAAPAN